MQTISSEGLIVQGNGILLLASEPCTVVKEFSGDVRSTENGVVSGMGDSAMHACNACSPKEVTELPN